MWSGETWAQNRGKRKAWPQSCLCFSENKNWKSLKARVRPRLSQGDVGAGKRSLFPQVADCRMPVGIPVLVRLVRTNATVSVDGDQWPVWDAAAGGWWWRLKRMFQSSISEQVLFISDSAGFDLAKTSDNRIYYRLVWVGRNLKAYLIPPCVMGRDTPTIPGCSKPNSTLPCQRRTLNSDEDTKRCVCKITISGL